MVQPHGAVTHRHGGDRRVGSQRDDLGSLVEGSQISRSSSRPAGRRSARFRERPARTRSVPRPCPLESRCRPSWSPGRRDDRQPSRRRCPPAGPGPLTGPPGCGGGRVLLWSNGFGWQSEHRTAAPPPPTIEDPRTVREPTRGADEAANPRRCVPVRSDRETGRRRWCAFSLVVSNSSAHRGFPSLMSSARTSRRSPSYVAVRLYSPTMPSCRLAAGRRLIHHGVLISRRG